LEFSSIEAHITEVALGSIHGGHVENAKKALELGVTLHLLESGLFTPFLGSTIGLSRFISNLEMVELLFEKFPNEMRGKMKYFLQNVMMYPNVRVLKYLYSVVDQSTPSFSSRSHIDNIIEICNPLKPLGVSEMEFTRSRFDLVKYLLEEEGFQFSDLQMSAAARWATVPELEYLLAHRKHIDMERNVNEGEEIEGESRGGQGKGALLGSSIISSIDNANITPLFDLSDYFCANRGESAVAETTLFLLRFLRGQFVDLLKRALLECFFLKNNIDIYHCILEEIERDGAHWEGVFLDGLRLSTHEFLSNVLEALVFQFSRTLRNPAHMYRVRYNNFLETIQLLMKFGARLSEDAVKVIHSMAHPFLNRELSMLLLRQHLPQGRFIL